MNRDLLKYEQALRDVAAQWLCLLYIESMQFKMVYQKLQRATVYNTTSLHLDRLYKEMASVSVEELVVKQRAKGPATVLAIGTAAPPNCYPQADYPDFYFRVTKSDHMTQLREKFKRMCMLSVCL